MLVVFVGKRVLMLLASRPRHITFLRTHLMFFLVAYFANIPKIFKLTSTPVRQTPLTRKRKVHESQSYWRVWPKREYFYIFKGT